MEIVGAIFLGDKRADAQRFGVLELDYRTLNRRFLGRHDHALNGSQFIVGVLLLLSEGGRQAESDQKAAVELLTKASDTQDTIPYMEPPFWYYPVRQSLGGALLATGKPDEAEKQFKMALEREPSSAWALYGLKEAAKAKGDALAEQKASDELAKAWRGDPAMLTLGRL